MQLEQMRQQSEQGKLQVSAQIEQFKAQDAKQVEQMKMAHATELEQMKQAAETERAKYKTDIDAQVRLQIAEMTAKAAEKPVAMVQMEGGEAVERMGESLAGMGEEVRSMAAQSGQAISETVGQFAQAATLLADAVGKMSKRKRRMLERDPVTGRATGMVEVEED
jgi:hypothetical protein